MVMIGDMETAEDEDPTKPAPGELRLVQLFVNSAEPNEGREDISDAASLGRWLVRHDLLGETEVGTVTEGDRSRVVTLREALRDLLGANAGEALDPAASAVLDAESARVPLRVRISGDGRVSLAPGRAGIDGAVARVLAAIAAASIEGTWWRLKACRDDTCRFAFYDASRNASSAWCSRASCGNRAKARRHRERRRAEADG